MSENFTSSGLKLPGEQVEFTKEEALEIAKCVNDPIYFIKNYIKIVHLDKGLTNFDMYPFQEDIVKIIHKNRHAILKLPRQSGKCFAYNTKIYVRSKTTGQTLEIPVSDFMSMVQQVDKSL